MNTSIYKELDNLEVIFEGGQKKVYKGYDSKYGEIVLKEIALSDKQIVDRALRELEIASRLNGSKYFSFVYDYSFIEKDGKNYLLIIEKYIEGPTLRQYLDKKQKLELEEVLEIAKDLLRALSELHKLNLVHRDIKPENIIINNRKIILLDLGIARDLSDTSLTADIALFGPMTIGYAAPEQIKNQKQIICNRTDLFAWAILIYELYTGFNPFKVGKTSKEEILLSTLNDVVPPLNSKNVKLNEIIMKCLDKAVHRRPVSSDFILNYLEGK
ncbi:serine/threonine-protein kinase [Ureibacillus thermosphaericus]|uniref:serine/threonine-protein kinase n=1 Tax=Ureibacillus thermosphaericus TaxID=51173 RepID=UPI0030C970A8